MLSFGFIFLSVMVAASAEVQILSATKEVTGKLEQEISIPCVLPDVASYQEVKWEDYVYNQKRDRSVISEGTSINDQHPRSGDYSINSDYTLTISQLIDTDSGDYYCVGYLPNGDTVEQMYTLYLVQLPQCSGENYLIEDQRETFTCQSTFKGQLPNITFILDGRGVGDSRVKDKTDFGTVKKELELVASPENDGQKLSCVMIIGREQEMCDMDLHVEYKAREVMITPPAGQIHVGDTVTCTAKGNPTPSVVFNNVDSSLQTTSQDESKVSFVVPEDWMTEGEKNIECTASNTVDSQNHEVTSNPYSYKILMSDTTLAGKTTTLAAAKTTTTTTTEAPVDPEVPPEPKPTDKPDEGAPSAKAGTNIVPIIAGVIIGIVILVIIIIAVVCIARRSNRNKEYKSAASRDPDGRDAKA